MSFAKIFESEKHGQILVTKTIECGEAAIKIEIENQKRSGTLILILTLKDPERHDELFQEYDQEKAEELADDMLETREKQEAEKEKEMDQCLDILFHNEASKKMAKHIVDQCRNGKSMYDAVPDFVKDAAFRDAEKGNKDAQKFVDFITNFKPAEHAATKAQGE